MYDYKQAEYEEILMLQEELIIDEINWLFIEAFTN